MFDEEIDYLKIKNNFINNFYNGSIGRDIPNSLEEDYDIALMIVENYPLELENLIPEFKSNFDICYAAIVKDGRALEYVSPELLLDTLLVKTAVCSHIEALYFIPEELKNNSEFLLYLEDFLEQKDFNRLFPELYNKVLNIKNAREHEVELRAVLIDKDEKITKRVKI